VDSDGEGYIILTHGIDGPGHRDMYIFRLSPDFLSFDSASSVGPLPGPHLVEAPAFFKRDGTYFALLGGCTCMGLYGAETPVLSQFCTKNDQLTKTGSGRTWKNSEKRGVFCRRWSCSAHSQASAWSVVERDLSA
jgi:hypothetical protein